MDDDSSLIGGALAPDTIHITLEEKYVTERFHFPLQLLLLIQTNVITIVFMPKCYSNTISGLELGGGLSIVGH